MELQIPKGLQANFVDLQIVKDLSEKRMPIDGEQEKAFKRGVTARREAARKEGEGFGARFTDNDRKKWSGKQLSEGTDLAQLYFCERSFEGSVAPTVLAFFREGFPALTGWAKVCRTCGAAIG